MSKELPWKVKVSHAFKRYLRVLKLTKKPSMFEFKVVVKVSSLGMAVIGIIGFLIHMVKQLLF